MKGRNYLGLFCTNGDCGCNDNDETRPRPPTTPTANSMHRLRPRPRKWTPRKLPCASACDACCEAPRETRVHAPDVRATLSVPLLRAASCLPCSTHSAHRCQLAYLVQLVRLIVAAVTVKYQFVGFIVLHRALSEAGMNDL